MSCLLRVALIHGKALPVMRGGAVFEVDDEDAETLADSLAEALEEGPGWYADLRSAAETVVVFPGKIFRYPRGEDAGRARAVGHGRHLGIPEIQLDWPM